MISCPNCQKKVRIDSSNKYRPFCSKKCKLIDLGEWANEEKKISRPIKLEDFYEDWSNIEIPAIPDAKLLHAISKSLFSKPPIA